MKSPSEIPLRVWVILPLSLLFGAVAFRLSWNIPASPHPSLWCLAIGGIITGYCFILRFLSQPVTLERLVKPWFRWGAVAGITASLVSATVYLYHQVPLSIAVISKIVLGLAIFVNVSGYLFLVVLFKPGLIHRLKTRPARLGVTVFITAALTCLTIHTIRFLPSPEAAYLQSKIMAVLLLAALTTVHPLVLRYIWREWRGKEKG